MPRKKFTNLNSGGFPTNPVRRTGSGSGRVRVNKTESSKAKFTDEEREELHRLQDRWSFINVLDAGSSYTAEEKEFLSAVEHYRKVNRRRFLTCTDYLAIAVSLGYRRIVPPVPVPSPDDGTTPNG